MGLHAPHDPTEELNHLAEELLQDNEKKSDALQKQSQRAGIAYGLLIAAAISGAVNIYVHMRQAKMHAYEAEVQSLEKRIENQEKQQEKLNNAMMNLRAVFDKATRYCKRKPLLENKMDELEDSKVDAIRGLAQLSIEKFFNKNIYNQVLEFTKKEESASVCASSNFMKTMHLMHRKIYYEMQTLIDENIQKLKKKEKDRPYSF